MILIVHLSTFSDVLRSLTLRSASQIFSDWQAKRSEYNAVQKAVAEYGRGTTKVMAICLVNWSLLKISYKGCLP